MKSSRVFDPTPKQLLATVALLMHEGEKIVPQGGDIYVGEGLPLVPLKLTKKVLSEDYVEMEELLPEVSTLEDAQVSLHETSVRHIYLAAILHSIHQHCGVQLLEVIPEPMAYITTIIRVNREYSGSESGEIMTRCFARSQP